MLDNYDREFLTPDEVAKETGSSVDVVRYMLRTGSIPGKKIGVRWYVSKEWLCQPSNVKGEVSA